MNWQNTRYNIGVTLKPLTGGVFTFAFPVKPGKVSSITSSWPTPIARRSKVQLRYKIRGRATFYSYDESDGLAPNFRVMLQRKGDDWSGIGGMEHYRWWSNPYCGVLERTGEYEIIVPVVPRTWSNVNGNTGTQFPNEFLAACSNIDNWQLVFGGGNSFSHGVAVTSGKARFDLLVFSIGN